MVDASPDTGVYLGRLTLKDTDKKGKPIIRREWKVLLAPGNPGLRKGLLLKKAQHHPRGFEPCDLFFYTTHLDAFYGAETKKKKD